MTMHVGTSPVRTISGLLGSALVGAWVGAGSTFLAAAADATRPTTAMMWNVFMW